jgi:hypothetical protein
MEASAMSMQHRGPLGQWRRLLGSALVVAAAVATGACEAEPKSASETCEAIEAGPGCPTACDDAPTEKVAPAFEALWSAADPGYVVRVDVRLVAADALDDPAFDPEVAASASPEEALVDCTIALIEGAGGEVVGKFTSPPSILARGDRAQGGAVASYGAVDTLALADVPPPPAGSASCESLGQVDCDLRADCRFVEGQVYDDAGDCLTETLPVACTRGSLSGGADATWAVAPTGQCVLFPDNLVPEAWDTGASVCPDTPKKECAAAE